jgi:hypothetical protein
MTYDPPIAYDMVLKNAQRLDMSIVLLRPIKSENIPVGISKIADERVTIENILIPRAKEPVTREKYSIATGA